MLHRLRATRPLVIVTTALLVISVCVPVVAAEFDAILTALWVIAETPCRALATAAPLGEEQTTALLASLAPRAPPFGS